MKIQLWNRNFLKILPYNLFLGVICAYSFEPKLILLPLILLIFQEHNVKKEENTLRTRELRKSS